ncbi:Crp/Fnr family transcriptional regulator [Bacillus sp. FJAT-49705]|uniref:Crp/Fnr family transcriptional regulator n=1 Tax=Cytobacillus citreus TaxID=2833586 RepID=A0ABS5NWS3_9BACI|nr:Crp/Fnr family transcriptional regulator [Cytobacillus citreus]MBS4192275.1 Crp/Fnr family transcriptional regulator [Cytobacillus citreus]MBS4193039.1 Crp/Fnr family transcriptional regulator [Cytobacillus citreus]
METNQLYPSDMTHLFKKQYVEEWMGRRKHYFKKGEQIYFPKKLTNEIYLLVDGTARMFHVHHHGKECVLGLLSQGDFIDLTSVFTDKSSNVFAMALTDVAAVQVRKQEIREQVMNTPELSMALLHYFSNKLHETVHILEQVAYEKVEERLMNMLRKLADPKEELDGWYPLPHFLTHKDIAGMIASTRETVTFLLNKYIQNGVIRQQQNRLWIHADPFT